jgi:hypothetical protein
MRSINSVLSFTFSVKVKTKIQKPHTKKLLPIHIMGRVTMSELWGNELGGKNWLARFLCHWKFSMMVRGRIRRGCRWGLGGEETAALPAEKFRQAMITCAIFVILGMRLAARTFLICGTGTRFASPSRMSAAIS